LIDRKAGSAAVLLFLFICAGSCAHLLNILFEKGSSWNIPVVKFREWQTKNITGYLK
jgi:hypothetical protein